MVLLVTPNTKKVNYGSTTIYAATQPNIYMGILESVYNNFKGIPCEAIHLEADGMDNLDFINYLKGKKYDEIGLICSGANPTSSTMMMNGIIELGRLIKQHYPEQKTFVWGGHPTVLPEQTKMETRADRIIIGDDFGIDPKNIPMLNWKSIDPRKYRAHNWHCFGDLENRSPYAVIWTTLGCPYSCEYCNINAIFQKSTYKMREIKDVIKEIDYLVKEFGVKNIKILDELFVSKNHKRLHEFCDSLIERDYKLNMWCFSRTDTITPDILIKLKAAGVNWIAYGFESVNQKTLDQVRKSSKAADYDTVVQWTRDYGISIIGEFIAGFWDDDHSSLEEMYSFMCKHNFEFINLYPLFAYPGTPLYDKYLKQGIIQHPKSWEEYSLYGYNCKPCPTKYLSAGEVLKWRDERYVDYYKRPEYLSMIESKFGIETADHVRSMANNVLNRKLWNKNQEVVAHN